MVCKGSDKCMLGRVGAVNESRVKNSKDYDPVKTLKENGGNIKGATEALERIGQMLKILC